MNGTTHPQIGVDLEVWRVDREMTYDQLAAHLDMGSASHARRVALGHERAGDDLEDKILQRCPGVDLYAMKERRRVYRRLSRQPVCDAGPVCGTALPEKVHTSAE